MTIKIQFEAQIRSGGDSSTIICIPTKTIKKILQNYKVDLKIGKVYDFEIILEEENKQ